jgi:signal transduction histidine kinase
VSPEVTVDVDVPPTLAVVADHLVLDRIVSNLLINAARYGAEPITLTAESRDSHLRIVVEDNGAGVPDDVRSRLFERFARSESAAMGSGLGLAIARTYARAHGGDLVYDPRDRGARFELVLPQR